MSLNDDIIIFIVSIIETCFILKVIRLLENKVQ